MSFRIVTIDGPAGCGKSTVSRELALRIGAITFSSGMVYRAVTLLALEEGADLESPQEILALLDRHGMKLEESGGRLRVLVDGRDLRRELYRSRVTAEIHWVADDPLVRAALLPLQRGIRCERPIIAEGRDMGTVVFPDALLKVFLAATQQERARRRHRELREEMGEELPLSRVLEEVVRRDRYDSERAVAPLRPAEDALVVDTTALSIEAVVALIMKRIPEDWNEGPPG
ncbi:MAG: (d)CMP kinase [Planctomycetota bacterium]